MTLSQYAIVIVFLGKKCSHKSSHLQPFTDPSQDCEMIKCPDLPNLIASLWHFDEKQLATSLFPVIAVLNSDQAP